MSYPVYGYPVQTTFFGSYPVSPYPPPGVPVMNVPFQPPIGYAVVTQAQMAPIVHVPVAQHIGTIHVPKGHVPVVGEGFVAIKRK